MQNYQVDTREDFHIRRQIHFCLFSFRRWRWRRFFFWFIFRLRIFFLIFQWESININNGKSKPMSGINRFFVDLMNFTWLNVFTYRALTWSVGENVKNSVRIEFFDETLSLAVTTAQRLFSVNRTRDKYCIAFSNRISSQTDDRTMQIEMNASESFVLIWNYLQNCWSFYIQNSLNETISVEGKRSHYVEPNFEITFNKFFFFPNFT